VAVELLSDATVGEYLVERGIFPASDGIRVRELGGGVSNIVLSVHRGDLRVVVKQALPRLRVADEWLATRERAVTEGEALRLVELITPGSVPRVLDIDRLACALTITEAPEDSQPWKDRLLAGDADPGVARRLGKLLGTWHAATSDDQAVASAFDGQQAFDQLRVDPYYRTVSRRRPELAGAVGTFVERMTATKACLVHGDYSPKNVLVGAEICVLDFEVAHYGDPAFDLAFMLNHLLLKRLHVPQAGAGIERSARDFWDAYRSAVAPELLPDLSYVLGHVGCLMVARVDGKSPAEYLREAERDRARAAGTELLLAPPETLDEALGVVGRAAA
jgi:5-methylthioribose kinase